MRDYCTVGHSKFGLSSFGPIGPPPRRPAKSKNPFAVLDNEVKNEESDSEDDDTVTWTGRKR
jgi:hypothetical protein